MDGINSCASRFLFYFYGAGLGVNVLHEQENPPRTSSNICNSVPHRGREGRGGKKSECIVNAADNAAFLKTGMSVFRRSLGVDVA